MDKWGVKSPPRKPILSASNATIPSTSPKAVPYDDTDYPTDEGYYSNSSSKDMAALKTALVRNLTALVNLLTKALRLVAIYIGTFAFIVHAVLFLFWATVMANYFLFVPLGTNEIYAIGRFAEWTAYSERSVCAILPYPREWCAWPGDAIIMQAEGRCRAVCGEYGRLYKGAHGGCECMHMLEPIMAERGL